MCPYVEVSTSLLPLREKELCFATWNSSHHPLLSQKLLFLNKCAISSCSISVIAGEILNSLRRINTFYITLKFCFFDVWVHSHPIRLWELFPVCGLTESWSLTKFLPLPKLPLFSEVSMRFVICASCSLLTWTCTFLWCGLFWGWLGEKQKVYLF